MDETLKVSKEREREIYIYHRRRSQRTWLALLDQMHHRPLKEPRLAWPSSHTLTRTSLSWIPGPSPSLMTRPRSRWRIQQMGTSFIETEIIYLSKYIYIYLSIYLYICTYIHIFTYIYINIITIDIKTSYTPWTASAARFSP